MPQVEDKNIIIVRKQKAYFVNKIKIFLSISCGRETKTMNA